MGAIQARDLVRTYKTSTGIFRRRGVEVQAVRGVSFEVADGELFGLLGPERRGQDDDDQDADHAADPHLGVGKRAGLRRRQGRARGAQANRLRLRRRPRAVRAALRTRQPPLLRRALRRAAARAEAPDRRAARPRRARRPREGARRGLLARHAAAAAHRARPAARPAGRVPGRADDRRRPGRRPRAAADDRRR